MQERLELQLFIEHERQGTYFTLPFTMPPDVESMVLRYSYDRHLESERPVERGTFIAREEVNIIDLGLLSPDGAQVGASGSDKREIFISETDATPGYRSCPLAPGRWQIIVGAYKVAPGGVNVTYEISFTFKRLRLLKGDLHTHTVGSDGIFTAAELGRRARLHGLDFLAITDHNQMVSRQSLPRIEGLTLISGIEWTHYRGHANFLGVDRPYDEPFFANTPEEVRRRFQSARERGTLIMINHPFEEGNEFQFDLEELPFDCLNVWNGPMRMQNFQAVALWQSMLEEGKKVPICGGSDYHRDMPFLYPGAPATCVYARSAGVEDILEALRRGHAYIIYAPDGPTLEMRAGKAILGDTVPWPVVKEMEIALEGLQAGDKVQVITARKSETILEAPAPGSYRATYTMEEPGFARLVVVRFFLPGIPELPALLSNPIYFEESR